MDLPKTEQGTGHEGVPEKLVPSHVRLLAADPGDQFDGLLGSEGVHGLGRKRRITMEGVAVCDAAEDTEKSLAVRREGVVYARRDHEFPDGSTGAGGRLLHRGGYGQLFKMSI